MAGPPVPVAGPDSQPGRRLEVIGRGTLRLAIRATDPRSVASSGSKYELPCTIDHAKRVYLEALIEECHGDLALIGQYWDHHSEKTLRALIHTLGLTEHLRAARKDKGSAVQERGRGRPRPGEFAGSGSAPGRRLVRARRA